MARAVERIVGPLQPDIYPQSPQVHETFQLSTSSSHPFDELLHKYTPTRVPFAERRAAVIADLSPIQPHKTKVYCVEDHPLVRVGLVSLLNASDDLEVCGESATYAHALAEIPRSQARVALVDISLPDGSGLDLIKELRRSASTLRICVFSIHDEVAYAHRSLRAGAAGYVMKSEVTERILSAIRKIASGQKVVSDNVVETFLAPLSGRPAPHAELTDREIEIAELYGLGAPSLEIATRLRISQRALSIHRSNLRRKFGLKTSSAFIRFCVDWCKR